MPDESQEIPVIDFGPFWSGTRAERQVVAEQMRRASQDWGFFYLSGCGMPTEQLEAAFSGSKAFFALPQGLPGSARRVIEVMWALNGRSLIPPVRVT